MSRLDVFQTLPLAIDHLGAARAPLQTLPCRLFVDGEIEQRDVSALIAE